MRVSALIVSAWQLCLLAEAVHIAPWRDLMGYDPELIRPIRPQEAVPQMRFVSAPSAESSERLESLPPFVPNRTNLEERYINGKDDRVLYAKNTAYPYASVGKLYWSNGAWCSGALVGPRHVLTAKHCLNDNASAIFAPGFDNKPRFGEAAVLKVITTNVEWGTPCGWKNDWAILIIDRRFGEDLGYLGVELPDKALQDKPIFDHVGYPGDLDNGKRPYRVPESTIQSSRKWDCDGKGPFYSDTDCAGGQSGGPIWLDKSDGSYVWGTLSVTFEDSYQDGKTVAWSGWGSGDDLLRTISSLRKSYP
ncbi:trypsin domain-containing protein [Sarocladium implicatum]|jgi:V8-like Glu-specific endopeptidase|nr:trypsin domain-containing protein [Sarocladium implicatum]